MKSGCVNHVSLFTYYYLLITNYPIPKTNHLLPRYPSMKPLKIKRLQKLVVRVFGAGLLVVPQKTINPTKNLPRAQGVRPLGKPIFLFEGMEQAKDESDEL